MPDHNRTAHVEENPAWARFPFTTRCYGQGVSTLGEGVPKNFMTRASAEKAARSWTEDGR